MSTAKQNASVGRYGERVAERALLERGMTVVERNWRCPQGEIDLVLRDGDVLVVCEVKTRSGVDYGHPLEAVDELKAARLRRLAARWIEAHGVRPGEVRIDIVGVVRRRQGAAEVVHVPGVG